LGEKTLPNGTDSKSPQLQQAGTDADSPLARLFIMCSPEEAREFYTPERRSIRIHGHSTTIRLENAFWSVLDGLAEKEGITVLGIITRVYDHCQLADQRNLASCLRVLCLKYIGG